jgi:hypothetical protein
VVDGTKALAMTAIDFVCAEELRGRVADAFVSSSMGD